MTDTFVAVEDLDARLRRLEHAVDDLDVLVTRNADTNSTGPATARAPMFDTVQDWAHDWFLPTFARSVGQGSRWCADWWDHAEALVRVEALWRTWETLRHDPAVGMATWLRDHCDPQLDRLLDDRGPFARCTPGHHDPPPPLPADLPPPTTEPTPQEQPQP